MFSIDTLYISDGIGNHHWSSGSAPNHPRMGR